MNLKLFVKKNVTISRCPNCSDIAALRRSQSRNLLEKIVRRFKFKYYSCQNCGWRGVKFGYKLSRNYIPLAIFYFFVILLAFYSVKKFLSIYFE